MTTEERDALKGWEKFQASLQTDVLLEHKNDTEKARFLTRLE